MSHPLYVVGDIHGQMFQLDRALDWITQDGGADAQIIFLGDLPDRGPDTKTVVETLLTGIEHGRNWRVIKGNHDRMFTRFVRDGITEDERITSNIGWLNPRLGGPTTLASYGVENAETRPLPEVQAEAQSKIPESHLQFLESLPLTLEQDGKLFVHAGIKPGIALPDQTEDDLIWIREPFLLETAPHPWLVVHGHTALDMPHHYGNRVNLDGGAGYGRALYPAVFENDACWLLTEGGRLQLVP
ncbi:MAG: metallophosphoesterase [Sedimentitalea sp.]